MCWRDSAKSGDDVSVTAVGKSRDNRIFLAITEDGQQRRYRYHFAYLPLVFQPYIEFLVAVRGVRPELLVEQVLEPPELLRLSSLRARASHDEPDFL